MPILHLGLDSSTHAIVDKSLGCVPIVMAILDFTTIKNELFPVIATVFSKTSSLGIKIRGLEAFVTLCGGSVIESTGLGDGLDESGASEPSKPKSSAILDKYTVQEKIVPLLKAIKTKEPAVMMAALAVFRQIGKIADAEFLAIDVLPMLWNFSLGPLLNLEQFQKFMSLIKSISSKIEDEQIRKLKDLLSNSNAALETSRSNNAYSVSESNGAYKSDGINNTADNDFERLVLGKSDVNEHHAWDQTSRSGTQKLQSAQAEPPLFAWSTPALNPTPNPSSRAITPDQTLSGFAALNSSSANVASNLSNSLSSFAPLQPSPKPISAWPRHPAEPSATSLPQQPNSHIAFSIRPPPIPSSPLSTFSIPPPPAQYQRSSSQPNYGGGLGAANQTSFTKTTLGNPNQVQSTKSGLDVYESLL